MSKRAGAMRLQDCDVQRTCVRCGQSKPVTKEFWFIDSQGDPGSLCKECTRKASVPSPKVSGALLSKIVSSEVYTTSVAEHVRDNLLHELGDVQGLVKRIKLSMDAVKPGSNADIQMLKMVLSFVSDVDKQTAGRRRNEEIDQKDLLAVIRQAVEQDASGLEDYNGDS